jgi:phage tail tube protein FII
MPKLSLPLNYNWANTYIDGDEIEATNGKTELPSIKHLIFDKELPGGSSSYPSSRFDKFEGQIMAMMPTSDALQYALTNNKIRKLSIQCGYQEENLTTGEIDDHTIVYDMDVTFFGTDTQSIEPNAEGEIPMSYEAKSVKITIDSVIIAEIDKRLGTNIINNSDLALAARLAYGAI